MALTRKAAVPFVLVIVLLDVIGFGLIIPVLPHLIGDFTSSRDTQAYWYGALSASYGLMQFFFAPLLGALSDRYGRRPVLLLSVLGLGLDFLLMAFAPSLWIILIARLIGGATGASFSVASAYIADVTDPENRAKSLGLIGAAFGIGFIIGPMAGGFLGDVNLRLPFFVASAVSLCNFAYGWFVLPESLPPEKRGSVNLAKANPFNALMGLTQLQNVGGLVTVFALTVLAQMILQTNWVLFTTFRFGWSAGDNGIALFVVGVAAVAVQGGLLRILLARWGEQRTALVGLASGTIAFTLYGLAQQGWMMYAIIFGNLLSFGAGPALQAIVSKAVDPTRQGVTMGTLSAVNSVMAVIAPLLGSVLLARYSHLPPQDWHVGIIFFVAAILQAGSLFFAVRHFARHPATAPARSTALPAESA